MTVPSSADNNSAQAAFSAAAVAPSVDPVEARRFDLARVPEPLRSDLAADPAIALALRSRELRVEDAPESHPQGTQVCAFFDIDGTLLPGSIVGQMVIEAVDEGRLHWWTYLGFAFFYILYKINLIPRLRMYRWGYGLGAGVALSESIEYTRKGVDNRVIPRIYKRARELLAEHRAQGHRLVAITGAPDYAAARVAADLGFDDVLATPTPVDGAVMGSELAGPLCYAEGKVAYALAYAQKHDIDLDASYFYSDSRSDLPLLEKVGHPVCVNPQTLLRWVAWRRGWPVIKLRK